MCAILIIQIKIIGTFSKYISFAHKTEMSLLQIAINGPQDVKEINYNTNYWRTSYPKHTNCSVIIPNRLDYLTQLHEYKTMDGRFETKLYVVNNFYNRK